MGSRVAEPSACFQLRTKAGQVQFSMHGRALLSVRFDVYRFPSMFGNVRTCEMHARSSPITYSSFLRSLLPPWYSLLSWRVSSPCRGCPAAEVSKTALAFNALMLRFTAAQESLKTTGGIVS